MSQPTSCRPSAGGPVPRQGQPLLSGTELAEASGATYRQIDYWVRCGYLDAATVATGSGTRRRFDADAIPVARALAAASDALFVGWLAAVADAAKATPEGDPVVVQLGVVTLTIDPAGEPAERAAVEPRVAPLAEHRPGRTFPVGPLVDLITRRAAENPSPPTRGMAETPATWAVRHGICSHSTFKRWIDGSRPVVSVAMADRICTALGTHIAVVWPEYLEGVA